MSGGPSMGLGTAGLEPVSSFPLWSALGLTAKAPAHRVFYSVFSVPKGFTLEELMDESSVVATVLGQGGWLNSAPFRLFLLQVTLEGGSWHSCVRQLLLGHGLSGSGKLLNHACSEVGKSCLFSASPINPEGKCSC